MNRFRLLEHTADMGVEARADSCAELFRQMALGLRQIISGCPGVRARVSIPVEVSGQDREELLVNWLSELNFLFESRQFLFADVEVEALGDLSVKARALGEIYDPGCHYLEREIKAVTYHQVRVEKNPQGWTARVYVDL